MGQPNNGTSEQWDGQQNNETTKQWDNKAMGQQGNGTTMEWGNSGNHNWQDHNWEIPCSSCLQLVEACLQPLTLGTRRVSLLSTLRQAGVLISGHR
jgi:hypothetical protein